MRIFYQNRYEFIRDYQEWLKLISEEMSQMTNLIFLEIVGIEMGILNLTLTYTNYVILKKWITHI